MCQGGKGPARVQGRACVCVGGKGEGARQGRAHLCIRGRVPVWIEEDQPSQAQATHVLPDEMQRWPQKGVSSYQKPSAAWFRLAIIWGFRRWCPFFTRVSTWIKPSLGSNPVAYLKSEAAQWKRFGEVIKKLSIKIPKTGTERVVLVVHAMQSNAPQALDRLSDETVSWTKCRTEGVSAYQKS